MYFDDILLHLGGFGLYQKRIFYLASLVAIPVAFHNVGSVFLAASMDHWCDFPEADKFNCVSGGVIAEQNATWCQQIKLINIPSERGDGDQIQFEQCMRYNISGLDTQQYDASPNTSGYTYQENTMACDKGWQYDTSQYKSSVVSEFNLVCDRKTLVSYSNSIYFAGILVGSILNGVIADWIGRYPTFLVCVGMTGLLGVATSFAKSFEAFAILRFSLAVFNIGLYLLVFILGTEFVGTSKRVFVGIVMPVQFGVGYMLLPVLAYFIRDWRTLQLVISLPVLLFFFLIPIMHESARWLITRGKYDRAEKIIRKAAAINKVTLPEDLFERTETKASTDAAVKRTYTQMDLFRTPLMRKKTIIIMYNWFVINMVYYGLSLTTSELGVNDYIAGFVSGAVEIPGILIGWYVIERWGRRRPHCVYMVAGGVACLFTSVLPLGVARTTVAMIGKFCLGAAFAIIYIFSAELYPTVVRSIGMGVSSMSARVSGVLSPIILMLQNYWQPLPLVIFGSSTILAGFFILLLPETLNESLPETLQDGELFGKNNKLACLGKNQENCEDTKNRPGDDYEKVITESQAV